MEAECRGGGAVYRLGWQDGRWRCDCPALGTCSHLFGLWAVAVREGVVSTVTERDFQAAVIETAHVFGWRVAHFRPARTAHGWRTAVAGDGSGFPDLVLLHPGRREIIARELKATGGKLSREQAQWLADLEACGVDSGVWCPDDWDEIERTLR